MSITMSRDSIMASVVASSATQEKRIALDKAAKLYADSVKADGLAAANTAKEGMSKALFAFNSATQDDIIKVCRRDASPVAALATVGVYAASSIKVTDEFNVTEESRDSLLSLSALLKGTDIAPDNMWRGKVKNACHLALYKFAQGVKSDARDLLTRMKASDSVRAAVKTAHVNNGEISYNVIIAALQAALDAVIFDNTGREDGKNKYKVDRASARWVESAFKKNMVTAQTVVPTEETMINMFFQVVRHVVAGMPYEVIVESKSKSK